MSDSSPPKPESALQPLPFNVWPADWKQVFEETHQKPYDHDVEKARRIIKDIELAKDATQDAGRKLSKAIGLGRLDADHCLPVKDGRVKARPWYVSVLKHTALDAVKKLKCERKRGEVASSFDRQDRDGEMRPMDMDDLPAKEIRNTADEILALAKSYLPETTYKILVLTHHGYLQNEIGRELGLTIDQIKACLRYAKPILQPLLSKENIR